MTGSVQTVMSHPISELLHQCLGVLVNTSARKYTKNYSSSSPSHYTMDDDLRDELKTNLHWKTPSGDQCYDRNQTGKAFVRLE